MLKANTTVRTRIDARTKRLATMACDLMGLSISDVMRLLLIRIAGEKRLPFEIRVPNAVTLQAMNELEEGNGKTFSSIEDFMKDLNDDQNASTAEAIRDVANNKNLEKTSFSQLKKDWKAACSEDYLLGIAALERNEKTINLEELEKELGLADKD